MNRDVLDRWCERGILGLVLAILVFGPLATGAVRSLEFLVIQGLTMGVVALWGLRLWLSPKPQFLWTPLCWLVIAFTAYAIARYLTCDIEYAGRKELIRILVYAFLFFAILNNLHRQESTQIISFTMIFLAMGISSYALYQFLSGSDRVWHLPALYKGRASGTYISPNNLAGFLEMLLPLALTYTLVGRAKPVTKVFLGYAALVIAAGIGVTVSRGSWLSAGGALIVMFGVLAFHRNYRLPSLVLMLVLMGSGAFFVAKTTFFKDRLKHAVASGKNVEVDMRYELWSAAARMWRDNVWFGMGPEHFDHRFRAYRPEAVQLQAGSVHNDYLNTLVDWGVVGAAIITLALVALCVGLARTWNHVRRAENEFRTNQSNKFAFVLGSAVGLLALLVHSLVDFNMQIPANAILAISLMALLTSHLRFATERYWVTARLWSRMVASVALLAGLVYLGYQEVRLGREYVWLQRAKQAEFLSPAQIAAREKAFAAEPNNFATAHAIGEAYWRQSVEGGQNWRELATNAMAWFARGTNINRFDGYNYMGYGMCLDWLERFDEAAPYFNKADELDPNGYFTMAYMGWHYVQTGDYAAARPWFERSLRLQWKSNDMAVAYLEIVKGKLLEAASKQSGPPAADRQ